VGGESSSGAGSIPEEKVALLKLRGLLRLRGEEYKWKIVDVLGGEDIAGGEAHEKGLVQLQQISWKLRKIFREGGKGHDEGKGPGGSALREVKPEFWEPSLLSSKFELKEKERVGFLGEKRCGWRRVSGGGVQLLQRLNSSKGEPNEKNKVNHFR